MKYTYDKKRAERAVKFIEQFCSHTKGELAGKPFILEEFQKEQIIRPLFGWIDEKGLRKYRTCYIEEQKSSQQQQIVIRLI